MLPMEERAVSPHVPALSDAGRRRRPSRLWLAFRAVRDAGGGVLVLSLALAGLAAMAVLVVLSLGPSAGAAGGCGGG